MTPGEVIDAWRVEGELRGGHTPEQTIGFVAALMDIADEQTRVRALPVGAVPVDAEPRLITRLRRLFGFGG